MVAELIGVGAGLLSGDSVRQNAEFLSGELAALGIELTFQSTVGDSKPRLQSCLTKALERSELVILIGGMGRGANDITKETIAEGLGAPLELHEPSLAHIKELYRARGAALPPDAEKQAMIPSGAAVFAAKRGEAAGCALSSEEQCILMLPENPRELMPMVVNHVYGYLAEFAEGAVVYHDLRVENVSAHAAAKNLESLARSGNPVVTLYPMGKEKLLVRVTGRAETTEKAEVLCAAALVSIRKHVGGKITEKGGEAKKRRWYQNLLPWKGDEKREIIRKSVLLTAIAVLLWSGIYIGHFYYSAEANKGLVSRLEDMLEGDSDRPEGYPKDYLAKFIPWWEINRDVAGRIEIEGTPLKYAIVQASDNDYYLRRTFYKKDDKHGVPFVDFRVDLKKESTNTVIYGHNMTDGQIFGELINYKNLEYYKQHPVIKFDSVYREGIYKIAAVVLTTANDPNFDYHNFIDAQNDQQMKDFIEGMQVRSLINTGIDVKPGDKLLTLSTCDYSFRDPVTNERIARLVVIARKVRAGENPVVDTSKTKMNPNPLMPGEYYQKPSSSSSVSTSSSSSVPSSESSSSVSEVSSESSSEVSSEESSEEPTSSESTSVVPPPSSSQPPPPIISSEEEEESSEEPSSSKPPPRPSSSSSEEEPSEPVDETDDGGGAIARTDTVYINGEELEAFDAVCRMTMNETGGTFKPEAIKAQAVAIYSRLVARGGDISGMGLRSANSTVEKAVKAVWGETIRNGNKTVDAYFFSISAGATNTAKEVWGGSLPCHNENVDSHWDEDEPGYKVNKSMSRSDVIDKVYSKLGVDLEGVPDDEWFYVDSTTGGNYNAKMTVGGSKATTGRYLRESVLGLRSAAFEWEFSDDKVIFTTYGYGHGCGMSQHGANGMAKDGSDYVEILEHYYPGCSVG